MVATEENGRYWDRWRARDHRSRTYTVASVLLFAKAMIDNDPHWTPALLVAAYVAYVAADLHSRLAAVTASIHARFDEQNALAREQ